MGNKGMTGMATSKGKPGATAYMTIDEFSAFLGVSRPTVYRMVREGELVAFKVGWQWRINPEASVDKLAANS